jgi:uncharacterized cupin superfamily protein
VALVTNSGAETLRPGDCAGFKAGDPDGHCLQNRSTTEATILEIGTRVSTDSAHYSEADMFAPAGGKPAMYTHKDGTPYTDIKRRAKRLESLVTNGIREALCLPRMLGGLFAGGDCGLVV